MTDSTVEDLFDIDLTEAPLADEEAGVAADYPIRTLTVCAIC